MKSNRHLFTFLLGFYLVWIIRATWLYSAVDLTIQTDTLKLVFSNSIKFALWVFPALAYVIWHDRQNPAVTMKVTTAINWKGLAVAGAAGFFYFALVLGFEYLTAHHTLTLLFRSTAGEVWAAAAAIFVSPIIEELFFRGFVLPQFETRFGFWKANLLQSALFVLVHWPNWIWVNGFQGWILVTSVSIFALGLFLGWVVKRTNSIWPAVALHFINNFLAMFLG